MFAFQYRFLIRTCLTCILGQLLFVAIPSPAVAQAGSTARKSMDVSIFAGYNNITPDYGNWHNTGVTFGANVTRYFRFPIKPSLEIRANISHGPTVNEDTYLFGVRGLMDFGRFHPYGDFLIGPGKIYYNGFFPNPGDHSYTSDGSVVESPGGGIDVDVYRNIAVKADFQGQFWNLGENDTLSPKAITFGVVYHFPFRPNYKTVRDH
jgi:hypothetical protein